MTDPITEPLDPKPWSVINETGRGIKGYTRFARLDQYCYSNAAYEWLPREGYAQDPSVYSADALDPRGHTVRFPTN
jgi:hypothetical protein